MDFTEFSKLYDDNKAPLYHVEGKVPRCPPGYIWNRERKDCVPKTEKDSIKGRLQDKDNARGSNQFNVWGQTGLNGDGYAYEEPFVNSYGGGGES